MMIIGNVLSLNRSISFLGRPELFNRTQFWNSTELSCIIIEKTRNGVELAFKVHWSCFEGITDYVLCQVYCKNGCEQPKPLMDAVIMSEDDQKQPVYWAGDRIK